MFWILEIIGVFVMIIGSIVSITVGLTLLGILQYKIIKFILDMAGVSLSYNWFPGKYKWSWSYEGSSEVSDK